MYVCMYVCMYMYACMCTFFGVQHPCEQGGAERVRHEACSGVTVCLQHATHRIHCGLHLRGRRYHLPHKHHTNTYIHTYFHTCIHTCKIYTVYRTYKLTYMHIHTYIHIYTYIHTYPYLLNIEYKLTYIYTPTN